MVTKLKKPVIVEGEDNKEKLGLFHVITGDGKGKTTAAIGLALRAIGYGYKVYMIQFLKSGKTGELMAVKNLVVPNITIEQYGVDALNNSKMQRTLFDFSDTGTRFVFQPDIEERKAAERGLEKAKEIINSKEYDLVILDEINCVLDKGLISIDEAKRLIANHGHAELIFTGRDAPKEIIELADYLSSIDRIRHPWQKGIKARRGIEY